jgi:hypothetical protein
MDLPIKRDRSNINFKKRWYTLYKNGLDIYNSYHADVYILLRRKGQVYEFKTPGRAWPLLMEEIVRS